MTTLEAPDDFYAALLGAHRDLTSAQSHALNAKLVLLLANEIGVQARLVELLSAARASVLRRAADQMGDGTSGENDGPNDAAASPRGV